MTSVDSTSARQVTLFGLHAALIPTHGSAQARQVAGLLRDRLGDRALSVVPAADSVLVNGSDHLCGPALVAQVREILSVADFVDTSQASKTVRVPVRYTGDDLPDVAALLGVSVAEVVARHTAAVYTVEFLGFAPGFPYLSGLDPFLSEVPRLDTPRVRVPAGSVGLAAGKTCVYPGVSPGGWRLLGATDLVLFDPTAAQPSLLAPGDLVRFEAVH